jgi:hypothetical protein
MTELITSSELAELAASAKVTVPTQIVAEQDKFIVRVTIKNKVRTVAAIVKGNTLHERKFPSIGAVGTFLMKSNIRHYQVDTDRYTPPSENTRGLVNQARMRALHKLAAEHTNWLRKEVEASRADPSPLISSADAAAMFDANIERLRTLSQAQQKTVAGRKKTAKA